MIITCPHCAFSKEIGDVTIPDAGVTATCKSCRQQFQLSQDRKPVTAEKPCLQECPSCGTNGPFKVDSDICPRCGLVFAKYRAKIRQAADEREASREISFAPAHDMPLSRQILTNRKFWGILVTILLAVIIRYGHDWKLDMKYTLRPGSWQGEMTFRGKQFPFLLVILNSDDGKLAGYMDWTGSSPRYRLAIRGTHQGNHLLFEDYKFIEGSGQYGLHDNQDVYIIDEVMDGTAKNGKATLHAIKVEIPPDPNVDLGK